MRRISMLLCGLCVSLFTYSRHNAGGQDEQAPAASSEQAIENVSKKGGQGLEISGYLQGQYQYGEKDAALRVGKANENQDESFSRIGIRRGRLKLAYEKKTLSGVFQVDMTEKGVSLRDVYLHVDDPWMGVLSLRAGVYSVPFGYEAPRSSSKRESPERSTAIEALLPDIRDVGLMLQLQPNETSPLHFLKIEAGLFAGNGIQPENDSKRDLIVHLSADKALGILEAGGGISYYKGCVYQGTANVYTMKDGSFVLRADPDNRGRYANREYVGVDGRLALPSAWGKSCLSAEYWWGEQPGKDYSSESPNTSERPQHDTYIRHFRGGYLMWVQDIGQLPFSAVVKYDWYDPNMGVKNDQIGLGGTGGADVAVDTFGFGALWQADEQLRLQVYYEIKKNETTVNLPLYADDRKDRVCTVRLQYMF